MDSVKMKIFVTSITFSPLLLGFILATIWWFEERNFEALLTVLGLLATITGIFAERWASAYEKKREFICALENEYISNRAILSDHRFKVNSHNSGRPIVFPRLIMSVTEAALASDVFAERKDRKLFSLLHQWRNTVNEFNRRLDITELHVFMKSSPQEIISLYEALQKSKEFNDAVTLTTDIATILDRANSRSNKRSKSFAEQGISRL